MDSPTTKGRKSEEGPTLFTPNVRRGDSSERYILYRHSERRFSTAPTGPMFFGYVEPDECGLNCKCAAFLVPSSRAASYALSQAPRFKNTDPNAAAILDSARAALAKAKGAA